MQWSKCNNGLFILAGRGRLAGDTEQPGRDAYDIDFVFKKKRLNTIGDWNVNITEDLVEGLILSCLLRVF